MDSSQSLGVDSDFLGYRLEELIGRGGMGVVYRAYDLRLKRPVALKLVAPALAGDERFRARFARESELLMSLEHPNVVPIHDAGDVGGRVYLAMRLVDGTDLGSLLRSEGAIEPARAMAICTQIAAALDAAHAHGLVHRDVKPSNVLLDSSEHVYLADFGLTRRLDDEEAAELGDDRSLGTPAYLAPEQLQGGPVDARTDVYSLGCVLFECLTGEPVFPRDSRLAVAWAHLEEAPPLPSRRRAGLPQTIDPVIGRALAKEPEQRFATCGGLIAAADQALGLKETGPPRRRAALVLAGGVVLAIAVAVGLAETALGHGSPHTPVPSARALPAGGEIVKRIRIGHYNTATNQIGGGPLAVGEGAVWAISNASSKLMRIDPLQRDRIVARIKVKTPEAIAAGDHAVWLTNPSYNSVTRLNPRTDRQTTIPDDSTPEGIAVSRGAVWVANAGLVPACRSSLSRINPTTNRVVKTIHIGSTGDGCAGPINLIASSHAVWVALPTSSQIVDINPVTNKPVRTVHLGFQPCGSLAADATGVWVTTASVTTDSCPVGVAPGTPAPSRIARFDTLTHKLTTAPEPDAGGIALAFGTVWVTASGNIDQIDPRNPRRVARLHVTGNPTQIGVGFHSIWVADSAGRVIQIKPQH